jgi:hypothetical protein
MALRFAVSPRMLCATAFALTITGCRGCRRDDSGITTTPSPSGADAASDASAQASTVVLGGALEARDVRWTSNGDVVVSTRSAVLRFEPKTDAPAKLLPVPEGESPSRIATSSGADVVAIVTDSAKLFVSRDGGPLREIANVGDPASVDVSSDGRLIAVDERPGDDGVRTAGLRDATTGQRLRTFRVFARFDPTSRFVASSELVAAVDGSSPDISYGDDHFLAWVGGRLLLSAAGKATALVLIDPATRERTKLPICGEAFVDAEHGRVVTICKARGALEIVAVPSGERTTIPLPGHIAADAFLVNAAREGDDLFVRHGVAQESGEIHDMKLVRVDPVARHVEDAPVETTLVRFLDDDPKSESALRAKPPHGRRSLWLGGSAKWPLIVRDSRDVELARWGPESSLGTKFMVRAHDRGLDVVHAVEQGAQTTARVRVGPPADGLPDEHVADPNVATGECGRDEHVRLKDGRELWYPTIKQAWQPAACACVDFTCTALFEGEHMSVLDARPDLLVLAHVDRPVTIRFSGPAGESPVTATIGEGASCTQARISVDGRSAAFYCTRTDRLPDEIVELDVTTGKELRRTKLPVPKRSDTWTLEAAGKNALVLSPPRFGWVTPELRVIEPVTGRSIADVLLLESAAVARFPGGAVEIFGSEGSAERALRCAAGDLLLPFATCRDRVRVKGRFALDL